MRAGEALLLAVGITLSACTSFQWEDASGRRHHAGLILVRETRRGDQVDLDTWSLGADLRLVDGDSGWSAGLSRRRTTHAAPRDLPAARVAEEYLAVLRGESGDEPPATRTWSLFHHVDDAPRRPQWIRAWTVGVDVAATPGLRAVGGPFTMSQSVDVEAMPQDSVLAVTAPVGAPPGGEPRLRCWRVRVGPRKSSSGAPPVPAGASPGESP